MWLLVLGNSFFTVYKTVQQAREKIKERKAASQKEVVAETPQQTESIVDKRPSQVIPQRNITSISATKSFLVTGKQLEVVTESSDEGTSLSHEHELATLPKQQDSLQ